jgi:hypothetical protein
MSSGGLWLNIHRLQLLPLITGTTLLPSAGRYLKDSCGRWERSSETEETQHTSCPWYLQKQCWSEEPPFTFPSCPHYIFIFQYKNPNNHRGIFLENPVSISSMAKNEFPISWICEKSLFRPPTSKIHFPSTMKSAFLSIWT